ncbi:defensin-like protein 165 [Carex littledalei]|uniref:Defensin-like protein 165 n=1 Tax=Carex littledalei TaxID=544730 RepID=A0A833V430_9POAL|nr:defensin-like protein 165 [Carex littledalei]
MAKLSIALVLVLLVAASVETMILKVDAAKRCQVVFSSSGCDLSSCRKQCYQSHGSQNGYGNCVEGKPQVYACVCYYDCGR